jgi:hypothetical protein
MLQYEAGLDPYQSTRLRRTMPYPSLEAGMRRALDGAGGGGYELRDQTSAIIRCAKLRTDLLRGIRRSPPTAGVHTDFYLDGGRHQTSYEPRH